MELGQVLPYLTGPAGALVVLVWVVWMQRRDMAEMRRTLELERHRADVAEEAARTTNQLLAGLMQTVRHP